MVFNYVFVRPFSSTNKTKHTKFYISNEITGNQTPNQKFRFVAIFIFNSVNSKLAWLQTLNVAFFLKLHHVVNLFQQCCILQYPRILQETFAHCWFGIFLCYGLRLGLRLWCERLNIWLTIVLEWPITQLYWILRSSWLYSSQGKEDNLHIYCKMVHTIPHIAQHVRIATLAISCQLSIRRSDAVSWSNRGGR